MTRKSQCVLVALLAAAAGRAQAQTPYPQYPQQGQYPSQSPGGTIGLPGGLGIPMPRLPGRKPKEASTPGSNSTRVALRAVDGTLRELGEKDLYLEAANHKIFKFRLIAKTQFRDKEGEAVRDSLLKPGDQLSVQVNGDDPETALRVILTRTGLQSERTAAGRPFDHDSAKTPVGGDTHSAGTMDYGAETSASRSGAGDTATTASIDPHESEPAQPRLNTGARSQDSPPPEPKPVEKPKPALRADSSDEIIAAARDAADRLSDGLPNFLVKQNTTRYYSTTFPARWRTLDVVTADVVSVGGKEEYRNIMVDGKPSTRPVEKTGSWSTGEFQTTLESLLSPYSAASFHKTKDDTLGGRPAYTYTLTVLQENSNWDIYAPGGSKATPAYSGSVWIDKETKNVLRIEEETGPMPADFPFDKAETVVEYNFVRLDANAKSYPLPVHSEVLTCQRGSSTCTKNEINFQNYRKFTADSTITFEK